MYEDMLDPVRRMQHVVVDEDGCWLFQRAVTHSGYGLIRNPAGGHVYVHKLVFESESGTLQEGAVVDHLCRKRSCCNPEHLELVSVEVNTLRAKMDAKRDARLMRALAEHGVEPSVIEEVFGSTRRSLRKHGDSGGR